MGVRPATADDIEPIIELVLAVQAEGAFRDIPLNLDKMRATGKAAVRRQSGLFMNVYEADGEITGFLLGNIYEPYFSDVKIASDLVFFLAPSARGGLAAFRLWVSFRDWAKAEGAHELRQGVSTGLHVDRTDRFFRKLGFEPMGQNYRLSLRP